MPASIDRRASASHAKPENGRPDAAQPAKLRWQHGTIAEGEIIVGASKTDAGRGRVVPLTQRARAALTLWLSRFPDVGPDAYAFPAHLVIAGRQSTPHVSKTDLTRPMSHSSYSKAFRTARQKSGVRCRFYDARHTFITRLAENPAVSVETIRQLAGHVDAKCLPATRISAIRRDATRLRRSKPLVEAKKVPILRVVYCKMHYNP